MTEETRYSLTDARRRLGLDADHPIDQKTLKDWMGKAGVTPTEDPLDKRFRYLARADVEKMAAQHGRPILEPRPAAPRPTITALSDRIAVLEAEIAALQAQKTPIAHQTRYDGQEGGSGGAADRLHVSPARKRPVRAEGAVKLPDGLILVEDFARLHRVSSTTFATAVKDIEFAPGGPWPVGNHRPYRVFDRRGQREAWEVCHLKSWWHDCPDCPHEGGADA